MGVIGGFYGLMLVYVGYDVYFFLCSEFEVVNCVGFSLNSVVYGFWCLVLVQVYYLVQDMLFCDWLLVGVKIIGNDELVFLICVVVVLGVKVLLLQNGLGVEEWLWLLLLESLYLLGGFCFICVYCGKLGVIEYQVYGGVNFGYYFGLVDE